MRRSGRSPAGFSRFCPLLERVFVSSPLATIGSFKAAEISYGALAAPSVGLSLGPTDHDPQRPHRWQQPDGSTPTYRVGTSCLCIDQRKKEPEPRIIAGSAIQISILRSSRLHPHAAANVGTRAWVPCGRPSTRPRGATSKDHAAGRRTKIAAATRRAAGRRGVNGSASHRPLPSGWNFSRGFCVGRLVCVGRPARAAFSSAGRTSLHATSRGSAMDAMTQLLPRAATGVAGLDGILGGGHGPQPPAFAGRQPRHRQDHDRAAIPAGRRGGGRGRDLRQPGGDRARAARRRRLARLDDPGSDRDIRARTARKRARSGSAPEPALFLRSRARRDHPAHLRRHPTAQAQARRDRQPVGDSSVGPELVALSPADPGAQALLRPEQLHRDPARRSHHRDHRSGGPQHRSQRHSSRPAGADLWRRAPPPAHHQVPRPGLRRRLS